MTLPRRPRYAVVAQPGPVALLERLSAAVRTGDIKRLALVLCRVPAQVRGYCPRLLEIAYDGV